MGLAMTQWSMRRLADKLGGRQTIVAPACLEVRRPAAACRPSSEMLRDAEISAGDWLASGDDDALASPDPASVCN